MIYFYVWLLPSLDFGATWLTDVTQMNSKPLPPPFSYIQGIVETWMALKAYVFQILRNVSG